MDDRPTITDDVEFVTEWAPEPDVVVDITGDEPSIGVTADVEEVLNQLAEVEGELRAIKKALQLLRGN